MTVNIDSSCPCGLPQTYEQCCGRYVNGCAIAPTAELLMRSRFVAYGLNATDYILNTWHPDTRPSISDLTKDTDTRWTRLQILSTQAGQLNDTHGFVQFEAHYTQGGHTGCLSERSQFEKIGNAWFYIDGQIDPARDVRRKIGRNELCPCGSGRKYKRCCGTTTLT